MRITAALLLCAGVAGCATAPAPVDQRNSALTQGNVQLNLKVGVTTKAEVLDKFGSPNITTRDGSGLEVWSFQRMATVSQSSSSSNYWTILLAGGSKSADGFSQTQRTMTLIIKFDAKDVVSDFSQPYQRLLGGSDHVEEGIAARGSTARADAGRGCQEAADDADGDPGAAEPRV